MSLATAQLITRILVLGTPLVWIAWDLYVFATFGTSATESHLIWTAYLAHRWIALLLGVAMVTLFWHLFLE
jgi:hypothetical protein